MEEESDLEMSGDFRLPMPVTKVREETVRFAKKMSDEKVDGFSEMLQILDAYTKSGSSVAVEFLAHLLMCNKTSIWDVFNDHFHKISLLATSQQDGRGTKPRDTDSAKKLYFDDRKPNRNGKLSSRRTKTYRK